MPETHRPERRFLGQVGQLQPGRAGPGGEEGGKPGTNLILRMLKLPSLKVRKYDECVRATSMVEVRWVEEIVDAGGLSYAMGVRYVHADCC